MMYGFGDDPQPYAESVELLEDLVVQYITDMVETNLLKFFNHFIFCPFSDIKSSRNR